MADQEEPQFAVRALGYSRREVDAFVKDVLRELRGVGVPPEPPEVRVMADAGTTSEGGVRMLLFFAEEEASRRRIDARVQAEQTLTSAREVAEQAVSAAREVADEAVRSARAEADQAVRAARAEADRIVAEARQRARELEERVSANLEQEVSVRTAELSRLHARLITGMTGMRDSLEEVLERDAAREPIESFTFEKIAQTVPRQPAGGALV